MEAKKVYIVYGSKYDRNFDPETWTLFTSYQKALSYTQKYKKNSKFKIKELGVDLDYISNKEQSPYAVAFTDGVVDMDHSYCDDYADVAKKALKNKYMKSGIWDPVTELTIFIFASSLEDAGFLAKKRRDELIASGEISAITSKL